MIKQIIYYDEWSAENSSGDGRRAGILLPNGDVISLLTGEIIEKEEFEEECEIIEEKYNWSDLGDLVEKDVHKWARDFDPSNFNSKEGWIELDGYVR